MKRLLMGGAIVLTMALAIPVLALDSRCSDPRFKDKPICQITETTLPTTTTTTTGETTTTGQETTTTTEPDTSTSSSSTTTVPTGDTSAIAGIGCSNTKDALSDPGGYLDQSDEDNIIVVAAGGHTIGNWAAERDWQSRYIGFRPSTGYTGVWLQLCERASAGLTTANVQMILDNVWESDPDIPIWISPMNFYSTESCSVTNGNQISNEGAVMADEFAAGNPDVFRGPDLGPLTSGMVRRDNCHPNSAGVALLGSQLVEFFDE